MDKVVIVMFVVHSPYPDKSWRGSAKCLEQAVAEPNPLTGVLFFETRSAAERAIKLLDPENYNFWAVWPVEVTLPSVRSQWRANELA